MDVLYVPPPVVSSMLMVSVEYDLMEYVATMLLPLGCRVRVTDDIREARAYIHENECSIAVLDGVLFGTNAKKMIAEIRAAHPGARIVVIENPFVNPWDPIRPELMGLADEWIPRPVHSDELVDILEREVCKKYS